MALKAEATADQIADLVIEHPDRVEEAGLGLGFSALELLTPDEAGLALSTDRHLVQWAPQDLPDYSTILLSLLDDQKPIDNKDPASLWSKQAEEYVDGL